MDEANQLVQALQVKLCELDHKILKYRQDMVAEFDKYAAGLLNDVPPHLSETILSSIKESKKLYTALYPGPEADTESTPIESESCAAGDNSDISTSIATLQNGIEPDQKEETTTSPNMMPMPTQTEEREGGEKDSSPRDPHAREKEFEGVFTPKYLPLLDDSDRNERRSSANEPPLSPKSDVKGKGKQIEEDVTHADASTDTRSLSNSPQTTRPPTPRRRNTDEVSIKSDWSDGPRRSALRRSSSNTKGHHSPRRVRFDVEGEEVLPTVSPAQISSPLGELAGLSYDEGFEQIEEEAGSEQIEDVEEEPFQKRISSTQALRALSRNALEDDGVQWTTVTAPPDGSASVATTNGFTYGSNDSLPDFGSSFGGPLATANGGYAGEEKGHKFAETPSDDETLDIMSPLRRQRQASASMLSPALPADIEGNKSPTSSTRSTGAIWKDLQTLGGSSSSAKNNDLSFDDDQEVMFNFDENVPLPGLPLQRAPSPVEYSDSDSEPELLIKSRRPSSQASSYSRSPARDIVRPTSSASTTPNTTTTGVVGSFKGQPFGFPVVNEELHEQAKGMGDVDTTFGSLRNGVVASYSRSAGSIGAGVGSWNNGGGEPRSFSERAMMDDIMEAEENARSRNGSKES